MTEKRILPGNGYKAQSFIVDSDPLIYCTAPGVYLPWVTTAQRDRYKDSVSLKGIMIFNTDENQYQICRDGTNWTNIDTSESVELPSLEEGHIWQGNEHGQAEAKLASEVLTKQHPLSEGKIWKGNEEGKAVEVDAVPNELTQFVNLATEGLLVKNSNGLYSTQSIETKDGIYIHNSDGVTGSPTIGLENVPIDRLANYPNDNTKILAGDGTWMINQQELTGDVIGATNDQGKITTSLNTKRTIKSERLENQWENKFSVESNALTPNENGNFFTQNVHVKSASDSDTGRSWAEQTYFDGTDNGFCSKNIIFFHEKTNVQHVPISMQYQKGKVNLRVTNLNCHSDIDMGGYAVTGLNLPKSEYEATNKQYVDNSIEEATKRLEAQINDLKETLLNKIKQLEQG